MRTKYIDEINKCGVLRIDPLNPNNSQLIDCHLLESMKFLHEHIFPNDVLSSIGPSPQRNKSKGLKNSSRKSALSSQNSPQSLRALKTINNLDIANKKHGTRNKLSKTENKENCIEILNKQF